jgi:hypothetical protein
VSVYAPTLFGLAALFAALGAHTVISGRRPFAPLGEIGRFEPDAAEADLARTSRFMLGPSLIAAALVCILLAVEGVPPGRAGALAYALGLAAVPLAALAAVPGARPRHWLGWAEAILWPASLGAMTYGFLRPGAPGEPDPMLYVALTGTVIMSAVMVRGLVVHWRDDAYIVEAYDNQGYIERPRLVSLRTKAVLNASFSVVGVIALLAALLLVGWQ